MQDAAGRGSGDTGLLSSESEKWTQPVWTERDGPQGGKHVTRAHAVFCAPGCEHRHTRGSECQPHLGGGGTGESPRVRDQGRRWPMVRTNRVQLACEGPADVSSAPTSSRPHPGLWSPGSLPGNLTQDTWFLSFLHCQVALGPCPEWGGRLTVTCVSLFAGCSVYSAGEHGTGLTGRAWCPLWPLGSWSLPDKAG